MLLTSWLRGIRRRITKPVRRSRIRRQPAGNPIAAAVQVLEDRTLLSAVTWVGDNGANGDGTDLNWNNPLNWSGGNAPGKADDVTIGAVSSSPITVSGGAVDVHSLNSNNAIEVVENNSLTLEADSTVPRRVRR